MAMMFDEWCSDIGPTADEMRLAHEAIAVIVRLQAYSRPSVSMRIETGDGTEATVLVPHAALGVLARALAATARGNLIEVNPIPAELTTQQAAVLLNVSEPYLIAMLEKGEIPCRTVGSHRRVLATELLAFKRADLQRRLKGLEELTALDQELGLGY